MSETASNSQTETSIDLEAEKKEILRRYKLLIKAAKRSNTKEERELIRKAFDVALEAHKDVRRKSGEPYIFHPIAVAQIVAEEIGLGTTAIVCALLHDVVEDTEMTLEDMSRLFNPKVAQIIDGLTKISGVIDQSNVSIQAENFRKILLTMAEDVRVILIKIADRLHNMRTLGAMSPKSQLKIASETLYLYAPLAHRLGLYTIKTELEDLSLSFTEPDIYNDIVEKLKESQKERTRFINKFSFPIIHNLTEQGFTFDIKGRTKSIFSIYKKMKKQAIPFEEVYDLFAIRIIVDTPFEKEKSDCWRVYSVVTDFYKPSPERLRDWISTPRANGYESLHTTVMSNTGQWVEVQIRTKRMDEIAEKGVAAHWKYKDQNSAENHIDDWLGKIREMLENQETNALDFVDDFKLNLFTEEIFVFTPKGELKTLPSGATSLDFAFDIHSDVGSHCIGAKVNNKLVPLSHKLKSGDQVEVLTSSKQKPKEDWLNFVVTGKAKGRIKMALKEEKRLVSEQGKEIVERKLKALKINWDGNAINKTITYFKFDNALEFYYKIATNAFDIKQVVEFLKTSEKKNWYTMLRERLLPSKSGSDSQPKQNLESMVTTVRGKSDTLVIGEDQQTLDYKLANCCNPIPGDDVFGFITINEGIKIHRVNCPNAVQMMSNYAYRVVKAKWTSKEAISFLAGLKVTGFDDVGIVNNITKVISNDHLVNMRSISFDSNDGVFEGTVQVYVQDTNHLTTLITNLKKVRGVQTVYRFDKN
jgi:guanosine-3',5'-bis(diphosphate) 3'-pyrophosphohydrolase